MPQLIPDGLENFKYQIGISSSPAAVAKLIKLGVIRFQVVTHQTQKGQFITNGDERQREWSLKSQTVISNGKREGSTSPMPSLS